MQLRRTETKVIDGDEFEVTQLGALQGQRVLVRVLKLIGPMVAAKDTKDPSAMLSALFTSIQEQDLEYLTNTFAKATMVKGKGMLDTIFDVVFVGKYGNMLAWLWFCLELNYGDFLKGVPARAKALATAGLDQTPSAS